MLVNQLCKVSHVGKPTWSGFSCFWIILVERSLVKLTLLEDKLGQASNTW